MKLRRQTYSLDQYLRLMKAETIRTDQECQRLSGQWNANMVCLVIIRSNILTNVFNLTIKDTAKVIYSFHRDIFAVFQFTTNR